MHGAQVICLFSNTPYNFLNFLKFLLDLWSFANNTFIILINNFLQIEKYHLYNALSTPEINFFLPIIVGYLILKFQMDVFFYPTGDEGNENEPNEIDEEYFEQQPGKGANNYTRVI